MNRRRLPSVIVLCALAATCLSGCVGSHVINPATEGERGFSNPNSDPIPPLMIEAVRWVATRYPPEESAEWSSGGAGAATLPDDGQESGGARFAVNLPEGVNALVYRRVCKLIGYGAVPMEPGNESLPTYHIGRIWVQGDEARVDVLRPIKGLDSGPNGQPVTQPITVRLRGGLRPWHVTTHNVWSFNSLPVPPLNYVPEK